MNLQTILTALRMFIAVRLLICGLMRLCFACHQTVKLPRPVCIEFPLYEAPSTARSVDGSSSRRLGNLEAAAARAIASVRIPVVEVSDATLLGEGHTLRVLGRVGVSGIGVPTAIPLDVLRSSLGAPSRAVAIGMSHDPVPTS